MAFVCSLALCVAVLAQENALNRKVDISIGPGSLEQALMKISRQANVQIVASSLKVEGRVTRGAQGNKTLQQALTELLAGTPLTFYLDGPTTISITEPRTEPNMLSKGDNVQRKKSTSKILGALVACNAAMLASHAACAQEASDGEIALEEITITGSRLITNGNDSPTPVTVLSVDQLLTANPGNITTAMMMMPAMLGTPNQGGQAATNFQAVLNLRGMGGSRNLVLFDGHRVNTTTAQGGIQTGVDSNLIPTLLLKRVDVVTGGASAVYGSDAVSGVINYIVDNNFNGIKINAQQSMSTYHDDKAFNIGIAAGTPLFGGRGHIEASAQRINDPGVADKFDRAWGRRVMSMQGSVVGSTAAAGSAANPYRLYENSRFAVTNFGGLINTGPLAGLQFAQNGVLSPFVHGTPTGNSSVEVGGDGGYYNTYAAFGRQKQDLGLARFDFDVTDSTKFYVEVAAGTVLNYNPLENSEIRTRAIGYNNAYLSTVQQPYQTTIATQLAANPLATFNYSRLFQADQMSPQINSARGRNYMYLAGLDGAWGDYKWSLGYEHSDSSLKTDNPNNISNARLYAAMNAVTVTAANVGSSGRALGSIACNAALVNPAVYGNCVPLNPFGPTSSSQAAADYIRNPTWFKIANGMDDVTASIAGSPFNSWAGPIEMAVSADWRKQTYGITTNAATTDAVNCTGIQFNCVQSGATATTPYFASVTNPFPEASVTVRELALESQVPLLKDKFLAQDVAFNAAVRYTDYSTSGTVWSWKAGLTWAMNDTFNVRATRSRDIRAPNLNNLFVPPNCTFNTLTDLHTSTPATVPGCTQGNPNLIPETADTWTFGIIFTPDFIPGLSVSLDGYYIDLKDAINGNNATQPPAQLACEASNGTAEICNAYIRPFPFSDRRPQNTVTQIINLTLNTGGVKIEGIDAEIDYAHPIYGHDFSLRLLTNFQPIYDIDQGPAGMLYASGVADSLPGLIQTPNVKSTLQLNYEVFDHFTATVQERYRNALKQHASPNLFFAIGKQPPTWYTDLNLSYKLQAARGDLEIFLNTRNLLNTQPTPWASSGGSARFNSLAGYVLGDDVLGRYYTLGIRYKM